MVLHLTSPDLERYLADQVKAGNFTSAEAVVEHALARVIAEDAPLTDDVLDAIDQAEEQIKRGETHSWEEVSSQLRREFLR
jgi:hypothetical protein